MHIYYPPDIFIGYGVVTVDYLVPESNYLFSIFNGKRWIFF